MALGMFVARIRDGMKVRLTKKFADEIDGIDLSGRRVGDTLDVPPPEARLLMAEEWAASERRGSAHGCRTEDSRVEARTSADHISAYDSRSHGPSPDRRFHR